MGATGTKLDRRSTIEAQVRESVRQLLLELGGARGLEELTARGGAAHLERELGLGSLERVEVLLRLGDSCGVRLPDSVMAEADTLQDLVESILNQEESLASDSTSRASQSERSEVSVSSAAVPAAHAGVRTDIEVQIERAESLTEIIRLRGLAEPERAHIHLYEEGAALRGITFGELYTRASAVAEELARRGFEPGQTAAIMLPTCAEFFFTFAGILLAGGIPVPIYPPFRADRIAEYATRQSAILRNAEARFLFTFRRAEGLARLLRPRVPSLREVINAAHFAEVSSRSTEESRPSHWRPVRNMAHHARGEDIAFLQYTSGSTGDPKGVSLTHSNLLANIRAIIAAAELTSQDVCVSWLPLYHDMGLIGAWFAPIFTGIPLVVMSPLAFLSRPARWLRTISDHRATISPAPNFAYELCVRKITDKDLEGVDLSSWRAAINGAETVRAETLERFAARFAPYGFRREAMLPVYGLAEATLAVSFPKMGTGYFVDHIKRSAFESRGQAIPSAAEDAAALEFVGAGRPLHNMEVRIAAADGTDAPERTEGRLWFRAPSATSGYYRNPAATARLVREDGWLDSGDLAYQAGGELFITGRAKDLIIKGGRNIYPHEVEEITGRVPGVRTGCVVAFGAPDERSGTERLVVAAEVRDLSETKIITAEIVRAIDAALGMPPDVVALLPMQSIPKTSSGKLRRSETRLLYLDGRLGKKRPPGWMQFVQLATQELPVRVWQWLRRGIRRGIEMAYGVYALVIVALLLIPLWILVSLTRERLRAARWAHRGARLMLFFAGVPVRCQGRHVLANLAATGPWIFAPNHSSYLDILIAFACLPPGVRFVAKEEVLEMPFFGKIAKRSGQFAFDRGDPQARIRQAEEVEAALRRGESVAIYPEGTFTSAAGIRPFQLGAFKSAVETQRPVCPMAVRGAREILRDHTILPRPGTIGVTFGPLLFPDPAAQGAWQEIVRLRDASRQIIARHTGEPLL